MHLDIFLGALIVIHIGCIIAWFFGLSGLGLEILSVGMWLVILLVAWMAGWQVVRRANENRHPCPTMYHNVYSTVSQFTQPTFPTTILA